VSKQNKTKQNKRAQWKTMNTLVNDATNVNVVTMCRIVQRSVAMNSFAESILQSMVVRLRCTMSRCAVHCAAPMCRREPPTIEMRCSINTLESAATRCRVIGAMQVRHGSNKGRGLVGPFARCARATNVNCLTSFATSAIDTIVWRIAILRIMLASQPLQQVVAGGSGGGDIHLATLKHNVQQHLDV
jgi:hypothetical protein